jgi:phage repressor protein C with HTH and peptisase S24 domain
MFGAMSAKNERLKEAREKAGYTSAAAAARAFGWGEAGYRHHENGTRDYGDEEAQRYARAFKRPAEWLLWGKGKPKDIATVRARQIALVGYVSAGAETYFVPPGQLGEVEAPHGSTEDTVAVEVRGDSLGPLLDRCLVFYDDVRRPVSADLVGRLCVVGLDDGRILIKKLMRSRTKGLFHLLSQTEAPILDQRVEWAAKVKALVPR